MVLSINRRAQVSSPISLTNKLFYEQVRIFEGVYAFVPLYDCWSTLQFTIVLYSTARFVENWTNGFDNQHNSLSRTVLACSSWAFLISPTELNFDLNPFSADLKKKKKQQQQQQQQL